MSKKAQKNNYKTTIKIAHMHTKIITGLLVSVVAFTTVSAMEMTTGANSVMKDTMMKDHTMKATNTMMKKDDTTADGMMKADVKVEGGAMMQK